MCDCFSPYLHATPEALRSPYPFPSFSCLILSFPIGKVHFDKRGHFVYNGPLPRNLNKALTVEVSLIVLFVLCLFFFIAGFVDSVAGGGGLISTPSMLLCGIPPHVALGTGKFASTLGSLSSLWTFARNHLVVMRIAPAGFVSAFLGGMLGSALAMRVPSDMLGKVLIFLLPVGMVISLFSGRLVTQEGELPERGLWVRVILMGLLIGVELDMSDEKARRVWLTLMERGFILNLTYGPTLRLLPPLTIEESDLEAFADTLEKVLREIA